MGRERHVASLNQLDTIFCENNRVIQMVGDAGGTFVLSVLLVSAEAVG